MEQEVLYRYLAGCPTDEERKAVVDWIGESPANKQEFIRLHRVYDAAVWYESGDTEVQSQSSFVGKLRPWWRVAAAVFLVVGAALAWHFTSLQHTDNQMVTVYSPSGQRTEMSLPDGSKVWLNANTRLTFDAMMDGKTRTVALDGEAYFKVTKHEERPFVVSTSKMNIQVLGTEFNVCAYAHEKEWETSLVNGKIELISEDKHIRTTLTPNTTATLVGNRLIQKSIDNTDYFLWREGVLSIKNTPLVDVMHLLSNYFDYRIVMKNKQIAYKQYTGKFRTKDGIEHVLRVLQLDNDFTYTKNSDTKTIIIH
uniref:DUF4974 domain-containing protein n=2 Tax=unclassified Prevotella TaxID=2638335 RepID=A0AB33JGL9_9BACT